MDATLAFMIVSYITFVGKNVMYHAYFNYLF